LYTDVSQGKHDTEAQDHLNRLKRQRIINKLGESNVTHYTVPWTSEGINVTDRRHQKYLAEFCNQFESDIHRLIDKSLDVMKLNKVDQNALYKEVLHHSWFCRDKCASFRGRQDILGRTKDFLCDHKNLKPLVIYGASGSGKTSIMAVIVSEIKKWLGKNSVCIFRFLGTSPDTSNIVSTITSISRQIHEVYGLGPLKEEITEDYSQLVRHFHELLSSSEISADKPLVLVIDSIDQLSASFNAHLKNWMPKYCSPNVKIIISVLTGYYDILPTLRRSLHDEDCYIEVPSLSRETGREILDAWLEGIGRTLNDHQRDVVMASFDKCPQPLFLKLIFTEASQWSSYTDVSGVSLGASVKEAIGFLFDRLERKHGRILVAHALGYMTAARNGLTENELEDILSLDDDVIDDVYQYWDPPVEGVVRLPNLLWARVRHDVNEFLVERQADKKTIVTWYHRQFWESAGSRYLINKKEKLSIHALMCDYFRGMSLYNCDDALLFQCDVIVVILLILLLVPT
jgi:DNA replication protein DnaC